MKSFGRTDPDSNQEPCRKHRSTTTSTRTIIVIATAAFAIALLALPACTPKEASDSGSSKTDATPSVEANWSPDSDCGTCHATEQKTYDNAQCEASLHKDVKCLQCHADEAALKTAHEGKTSSDKMPTRLKKTQDEDAVCFSCHENDRAGLIAATDGKAVLTDSEGTSRNPHDPQGIAEHETLACADCHNMHSTEELQERAMSQCTSCHHAGVFACYTCHDAK